ncbi:MAG TPA: TetR/AcrR family transcriptional regulator [Ktedonobacterales bacterium]
MPQPVRDEVREVRDKRQAILEAAQELFAEQGYDETTIAEIARAAGVAVGTVYLYFTNKHEIQIDVCLALNYEIAKVIQSPAILALPLRQVPRAIIEASFRSSRENMRFMRSYQVDPQTPAEAARLREGQKQVSSALESFFNAIISRGEFPPFNTAAYAELLDNLVGGTLQRCFAYEQGEREDYYREGLIDMVDRLFFGPPLAGG